MTYFNINNSSHHRTAGDLRLIFGGLGTGLAVEQEATGVNLFAVIGGPSPSSS